MASGASACSVWPSWAATRADSVTQESSSKLALATSLTRRIDPQTGKILKPGRFEDIEYSVPVKPLPTNFNTKLTEEHMERTEVSLLITESS